jgi:hypothetical protein
MPTREQEYWTLVITMIIGGLVYSVVSFAYMQATFTTRQELDSRDKATERYDGTVKERLDRIELKLDALLQEKGK